MKKETATNHFGSMRSFNDPRKQTLIEMSDTNMVSTEEVSLINARPRKKLNHRKMIDLYKIR